MPGGGGGNGILADCRAVVGDPGSDGAARRYGMSGASASDCRAVEKAATTLASVILPP